MLSAIGAVLAACAASPEPPGTGDPAAAAAATPESRTDPRTDLPPAPVSAEPATVTGMVPPAVNDLASVVVLQTAAAYRYPAQASRPLMDQMARRFTPGVLVVRTGEPADFRNDDDAFHNVRVRERGIESDEPAFNIALSQGGAYAYTFQKDGVWDVRCDMHQSMAATVVSASTPYATVADADGAFTLANVPPGAYTLVVYTADRQLDHAIVLAEGQRLRVTLR